MLNTCSACVHALRLGLCGAVSATTFATLHRACPQAQAHIQLCISETLVSTIGARISAMPHPYMLMILMCGIVDVCNVAWGASGCVRTDHKNLMFCENVGETGLNRIRPAVDPQLDTSQDGFRWGSDVQVHVLYEMLRRQLNYRKFQDIRNTFDVTWRDGAVLKLHRAPELQRISGTLLMIASRTVLQQCTLAPVSQNLGCGNWRWTGSCVERLSVLSIHHQPCSSYQACVPRRDMWPGLSCPARATPPVCG